MWAECMWIVGIETSGLEGSAALLRKDEVIAERRLATAGRRHAQTLLAEIRDLLLAAGLSPRSVDAVAVSLGPGSFTGLRVGVVCAKTWAYATRCQVIGLETFLICAAAAPADWSRVWVVADAQRGDFFAAEYQRRDELRWQRITPLTIVSSADWLRQRQPGERIAGPGVTKIAEGSTAAFVAREEWSLRPSAAVLARQARQLLAEGRADDFWTLVPIYLRPSAAEEKRAPAAPDTTA